MIHGFAETMNGPFTAFYPDRPGTEDSWWSVRDRDGRAFAWFMFEEDAEAFAQASNKEERA